MKVPKVRVKLYHSSSLFPRKLTWHLKMDCWKIWNTNFLLGRPICRGYVVFKDCICMCLTLSHLSLAVFDCFRIAHTLQEEPSLLEYMINDTWSEFSISGWDITFQASNGLTIQNCKRINKRDFFPERCRYIV